MRSWKQIAAAASEASEEDGIIVPPIKFKKRLAKWGKGGNIVILINALHDWICDNNTKMW